MGLERVGIKYFSPILKEWASKAGVRSIAIESKPVVFRGINPTLTYPPTGKTFALPRFCTEEMKQARQMNKIAARQAKAGNVVRTYPKATPQDLKRLTSETIEDSYSRVEWTNPKDGKVYNLLKQSETKDGKVVVRILDEEGAFVKEAEIVPKNIAIFDDFIMDPNDVYLSHGDRVRIFVQRNNPFAKIRLYPTEVAVQELENIKGKPFDYISISAGKERYRAVPFQELNESLQKLLTELNSQIQKGTRVIVGAGNEGRFSINSCLYGQIEGVGSISKRGKISDFSASRNSRYTQHYEVGEYKEQIVYNEKGEGIGLNITGKPGCDYMFDHKILRDEEIQKLKILEQQKSALESHYSTLKRSSFNSNEEMERYVNNFVKEKSRLAQEMEKLRYKIGYFDDGKPFLGTSFSTPVRTAKLALNDMMEGVL